MKTKTYLSPDEWFSLEYPYSWNAEDDEEATTFYNGTDGVGALQLSAYSTDRPQSATQTLQEHLSDEGIKSEIETVIDQNREMASSAFELGNNYTRVFFITEGQYLLF